MSKQVGNIEIKYSKKELALKQEYEYKKRDLDEKFDRDTKKLKSERDKLFVENNELKIKNSNLKDVVRKLANEAVDILKELLNRTNV